MSQFEWVVPPTMTIRSTVYIDPISERDPAAVLHVPRGHPQSKELADSGYWPHIYLTDYQLDWDQVIDLAAALTTLEEDKLFLEKVLEALNEQE